MKTTRGFVHNLREGTRQMAMTMVRHDRILLGVHNATPPTDAEWSRWLALAAERTGQDLRTVVEVYGGVGPNARQRNALTPILAKLDPRTAVLTNSLVVRGIATAVSWLGIPVAAFGAGQHTLAARYLELTADEEMLVRAHFPALRHAAGVSSSASSEQPRAPHS